MKFYEKLVNSRSFTAKSLPEAEVSVNIIETASRFPENFPPTEKFSFP